MRLGVMRRLHFVGIGGVGMCGLAEALAAYGAEVSGCDAQASERTRLLEGLGVRVHMGHDADHLRDVDALVVSAAVDPAHPEVVAARARRLPVVKRSVMLAEVMRGRHGVAVAGTHGKTTTTALTAHLLTAVGLDPTVIVGGRVRELGSHARIGGGDLMVCEADEFDRSFLELRPVHAVITNVEPEHLECYGSVAELEAAFREFAARVPFYGAVVYCADDPGAVRVVDGLSQRTVSYGLTPDAMVRANVIESDGGSSRFELIVGDRAVAELTVPVAGDHNIRNALAAVAVGMELGLAAGELAAACASYGGVARRFERLGEARGVEVVDDYAHHPTEVSAVLAAARSTFRGRRLVAVFQPHLYSRTRTFAEDFGKALSAADEVVVLPIYPARERPIPGVDATVVVSAVRAVGGRAIEGPGPDRCGQLLDELLKPGDVLLTLGAGDVHRVAEDWLRRAS